MLLTVFASVSSKTSGCKLLLWSLLCCEMISFMLMVGLLLVRLMPIPKFNELQNKLSKMMSTTKKKSVKAISPAVFKSSNQ